MTIFDDYFNYCDKWKKIYGEKTYVLMEGVFLRYMV